MRIMFFCRKNQRIERNNEFAFGLSRIITKGNIKIGISGEYLRNDLLYAKNILELMLNKILKRRYGYEYFTITEGKI